MSKTKFGITLTIFCCLIALVAAACGPEDDARFAGTGGTVTFYTTPTGAANEILSPVPVSWCQAASTWISGGERWSERGPTCHADPKLREPPICALQDRDGVLYDNQVPCPDGWGAKTDAAQSWKVAADEPRRGEPPQTAGPTTTGPLLSLGTAKTLNVFPIKPTTFVLNFGSAGKSITLRPDGRVELNGLNPDEASALFWERLQQIGMRLACPDKLDGR